MASRAVVVAVAAMAKGPNRTAHRMKRAALKRINYAILNIACNASVQAVPSTWARSERAAR